VKTSAFAVSSSCPAAPLTQEIATALLERLRQVEYMWVKQLTDPQNANARAWGCVANVGLVYSLTVGNVPVTPDACRVELVADFSAVPGVAADDIAFHTLDSLGRAVCYISYHAAGADWPSAASHEIAEARVNATCAQRATAPDGTQWDVEVCDPVQGSDAAPPGTTVPLANACGPRFFWLQDDGPLDLAGVASTPFHELPGGYHDGSAGQVFGERVSPAKRAEVERNGVRGKRQR
jgi:hypothetical protein